MIAAVAAGCGGESDSSLETSGAMIAFTSDRDGDNEIYVMNADGSGTTQITDNDTEDGGATWSPDRTQLAYATGGSTGTVGGIVIRTVDGELVDRLGQIANFGTFPDWSPDGASVLFHRPNGGGDTDLIGLDLDGTSFLVANGPTRDLSPSWSPDGADVAFASDRDGDDLEIHIGRPDEEGTTQLTDNDALDASPDWSPDGALIAFDSDREGSRNIYVIGVDGSGEIQLTDGSSNDQAASWSPDGSQVAFQSDRDGNWNIYVMEADGSNVRQITDSSSNEILPAWAPGSGN